MRVCIHPCGCVCVGGWVGGGGTRELFGVWLSASPRAVASVRVRGGRAMHGTVPPVPPPPSATSATCTRSETDGIVFFPASVQSKWGQQYYELKWRVGGRAHPFPLLRLGLCPASARSECGSRA